MKTINPIKFEDELLDAKETRLILDHPTISHDFITSMVGKKIGEGYYRSVYEYNFDKNFVIKIEPRNTNCNTVEYMLYNEIQYLKGNLEWVKKWFAPVQWISPNGKILVMMKTVQKDKKKPAKIPKFLWDVKSDNFGWIGNDYVCHDYGQFYNFISYTKGFKNIDWNKIG